MAQTTSSSRTPTPSAGGRATVLRARARRLWRTRVLAHRHLLAACCAVGAVLAGLGAVAPPAPDRQPVLVAGRDLPSGTVLSPDDLVPASWARGTRPDGVADDPVGRTLAAPLRRGEPVTDLRLTTPGLLEGYPGLVALPVRIPDPASVALLRVGDRVDLVATDPRAAAVEVVAREAPVLALPRDDDADRGAAPAGRVVVLGLAESDLEPVSLAAAGQFLAVAFSR